MSQENVKIAKRLFEAWERDGYGVVRELMDPEVEWVNPSYAVEPGTRHGYDGFEAAVQALVAVYPDIQLSATQFAAVGDRVVVTVKVTTQSTGLGVPIAGEQGYVLDLRDGKVTRFAWFNDPREALEAVGLAE